LNPFASPAVRVLSVLAASSLVLAFALAVTMAPSATLAHLITRWNPAGVAGAEAFMLRNLPDWAWHRVAVPMLTRPCWLVPVDAALVLGGVAVTIALRRAHTTQRRRS